CALPICLAARLPRALAHPAPARRRRQARGCEPGRARGGRQRDSTRAGGGGGGRRRWGKGARGGARAPAGAQSRRPVLAVVALSRDFLEKVAVSSSFSYTGAIQPTAWR